MRNDFKMMKRELKKGGFSYMSCFNRYNKRHEIFVARQDGKYTIYAFNKREQFIEMYTVENCSLWHQVRSIMKTNILTDQFTSIEVHYGTKAMPTWNREEDDYEQD